MPSTLVWCIRACVGAYTITASISYHIYSNTALSLCPRTHKYVHLLYYHLPIHFSYTHVRIDLRRPTDTTLFLIVKQASRSLKYQKDSICLLNIRSMQCHFLELGSKTVSGRNWTFLPRSCKMPAIFPINESLLYTQICYRINLFTF